MAITVGTSTITMNSGAVVQAPSGTASCYTIRAFANWDGTGSIGVNATIRQSGGVSSISKFGTGGYTINFSPAMPSGEYILGFGLQNWNEDSASEAMAVYQPNTPSTTSFQVSATRPAWAYVDVARLCFVAVI